jgi:hypothetical protein
MSAENKRNECDYELQIGLEQFKKKAKRFEGRERERETEDGRRAYCGGGRLWVLVND